MRSQSLFRVQVWGNAALLGCRSRWTPDICWAAQYYVDHDGRRGKSIFWGRWWGDKGLGLGRVFFVLYISFHQYAEHLEQKRTLIKVSVSSSTPNASLWEFTLFLLALCRGDRQGAVPEWVVLSTRRRVRRSRRTGASRDANTAQITRRTAHPSPIDVSSACSFSCYTRQKPSKKYRGEGESGRIRIFDGVDQRESKFYIYRLLYFFAPRGLARETWQFTWLRWLFGSLWYVTHQTLLCEWNWWVGR